MSDTPDSSTRPRRPGLAALASLLLPGLGQFYIGSPRAAVAWAVGVQVVAWFGILAMVLLPPSPVVVLLGFSAVLYATLGAAVHAGLAARRAGLDHALRPFNRWYAYVAAGLLLVAWQTASGIARHNVAQAFSIASSAMGPTLLTGDRLLMTKLPRSARTPRPGAVVVFRSVEAATPGLELVKRVIGTAGDTLRMVHDTVYRNGVPLEEPYTWHMEAGPLPERMLEDLRSWQRRYYLGRWRAYRPTSHDWGPIVVPADSCFVLGDNRDDSWDSRFYGFVPAANIEGTPRLVYFSWDPVAGGVRWRRIGLEIK